jgi:hypothetical protein
MVADVVEEHSEMTGHAHRPLDRLVETDHGVSLATLTPAQMRFVSWTIDVLLSVIILNLFMEFAPDHIRIDSFWITLLVASLFKILLAAMDKVKYRLQGHLRARGRAILATLGVLPVFFVGKLVILETVDAAFRQVELDGFWYEWFLIFFLIVIPAIVWAIFDRLGSGTEA